MMGISLPSRFFCFMKIVGAEYQQLLDLEVLKEKKHYFHKVPKYLVPFDLFQTCALIATLLTFLDYYDDHWLINAYLRTAISFGGVYILFALMYLYRSYLHKEY
jgi:hypothetical protein